MLARGIKQFVAPMMSSSGTARQFCSALTPEGKMSEVLRTQLEATHVEVEDISGGCGAMYKIDVISPKFKGVGLV